MKPLERIFFMACVMKHPHQFIRDICNIFDDLGFPIKRLWYYLEKWTELGFYDYGVTLDLGWFYLDKLPCEYSKMLTQIDVKRGGERHGKR